MLNKLLNDMYLCFISPINLKKNKEKKDLHSIFLDFNNFNLNDDFEKEVLLMNKSFSCSLHSIKLYFLFLDFPLNLIAGIIHAINTFCCLFPFNYKGLSIYICLDENKRIISKNIFNISGITDKYNKTIILTKKEEIIKLLFHELIHYIGLDSSLLIFSELKYFEAYTELLSVIFFVAYKSIHYKRNFNKELNKELKYSLLLTSNILKYYGYGDNYRDFFKQKKYEECKIPIWEYVLLRTQLFLNIDKINNWKTDTKIIKYMEIDNNLINKLSKYMKIELKDSISYLNEDLIFDNL